MNVMVVDDERIILQTETIMIRKLLQNAKVESFSNMEDALDYARNNSVAIAFLDINLEAGSGMKLARELQDMYPEVNIIFCTGYAEYSLEALELYCSGYLMKPVTEEKLKGALRRLRYGVSEKVENFVVNCFGNFEVIYNGTPVKFKYGKTKQLFAYLIDRKGAVVGIREIMAAICEDDEKESYIRNLKAD